VTRPLFLLGSVALATLGTSIAWWAGSFHLGYAILAFLGLLLWHTSVNVLNEYFDFRSGIDTRTRKTPFSGGSGILPSGLLRPRPVLQLGLLLFALAIPIWVYFIVTKGLLLLPLLVVGGLCVVLYTPILTRQRLAEVSSSIGIGVLPILALYFVQAGAYALEATVVAVASGLLMFNVHLMNEFPDAEADAMGGRRTLPIVLGRKGASYAYAAVGFAFYAWIAAWAAAELMPWTALLALVTLPFFVLTVRGAFNYRGQDDFVATLWVGSVGYFLSMALLALGYIIAGQSA
jgi:1,4-dihydroxy-2-naphthoate octaprenyltransferase